VFFIRKKGKNKDQVEKLEGISKTVLRNINEKRGWLKSQPLFILLRQLFMLTQIRIIINREFQIVIQSLVEAVQGILNPL
jgi:hypothetical protein